MPSSLGYGVGVERMKKYAQLLKQVAGSLWRDMTTPKWLPVWEQLAAQTGAELQRPKFLRPRHLLFRYRDFTIELFNTLDESPATHLQTKVKNETRFRFGIGRKNIFNKLAALLGFPRVHSGYTAFDEAFSMTSSSEAQLLKLLEPAALRDLIATQADFQMLLLPTAINITGKLTLFATSDVSNLRIETQKIVDDLETLKRLVTIQQRVLDGLCEQGISPAG